LDNVQDRQDMTRDIDTKICPYCGGLSYFLDTYGGKHINTRQLDVYECAGCFREHKRYHGNHKVIKTFKSHMALRELDCMEYFGVNANRAWPCFPADSTRW
jgi:hypothetical protein